jgi:hypothetical protein
VGRCGWDHQIENPEKSQQNQTNPNFFSASQRHLADDKFLFYVFHKYNQLLGSLIPIWLNFNVII